MLHIHIMQHDNKYVPLKKKMIMKILAIIIPKPKHQEIVVALLILYTIDCLFRLFLPPITRHSVGDSDTVAAAVIGDGRSLT